MEIDISRSSKRRMRVYAAVKVPEVWRFDGDMVTIYRLAADGAYSVAEQSQYFPFVSGADLARFLQQCKAMDVNELVEHITSSQDMEKDLEITPRETAELLKAGRIRLLLVKYAMIVVFCVTATLLVAGLGLLMGVIFFPVGPVTLLSGTTVSLGAGLVRLLFVTLYCAAAMAALGALGLAISTLTEHAIGAIAAAMIVVVTSEVVDNVPQLSAVGPFLPTHWWLDFDSLLRAPVDTAVLARGLLSFAVYAVLCCSFAWARFTSSDVTS